MSTQTLNQSTHVRGTHLGRQATLVKEIEELRPRNDPGIYWGGLHLPTDDATRHFCVMGATGSGKTVLLRLLMQSVIPRIKVAQQQRRRRQQQQEDVPTEAEIPINYNDPLIVAAKNRKFKYPPALLLTAVVLITVIGLVLLCTTFVPGVIVLGAVTPFWGAWRESRSKFICAKKILNGAPTHLSYESVTQIAIITLGKDAYKFEAQKYVDAVLKTRRGVELLLEPPPPTPPADPSADPSAEICVTPEEGADSHAVSGKCRAIVYDAKQDVLSLIKAINPDCPLVILNPFDKRCAAWDMAKDISKPSSADQVATILIPQNRSASQPYFSNAARQLLGGVFKALILLKPGEWNFRDVVLATRSKERLKALLQRTPHTNDLIGQYLVNEMTAGSILSELATHMGPYEHIAAAWSKADEKVSLSDWILGESILVLGNDESHRAALDAVNRLVFQRLTEIILAQPETHEDQTWVFLDEVREAGELEGLSSLLNKGRSKGACVVLGFQDIDGMRSVYGDKIANEIIGQCNHMALLRLNSPTTAQWASERIGQCETIDEEESFQEGTTASDGSTENTGLTKEPGWFMRRSLSTQEGHTTSTGTSTSTSTTRNQKKVIKAAVLPSEFLGLPLTNRANGLSGFFIVPQVRAGAYRCEMPGSELFPREKSKAVLVEPDRRFPNFKERPAEDEYLLPWTDEELTVLGLEAALLRSGGGGGSPASGAQAQAQPEAQAQAAEPSSAAAASRASAMAAAAGDVPRVFAKDVPGAIGTRKLRDIKKPQARPGPVPQADPEKTARLQALLDRRNS